MDFITQKFKSEINFTKSGSSEKRALLQARIEYLFYFMLGYLWNENKDSIAPEQLSRFVRDLDGNLTIGRIIYALKMFDFRKESINKKAEDLLKKYNHYRNDNIGHGFIFGDKVEESETILDSLYKDLVDAVPLLKAELDIVIINSRNADSYKGLVYHPNTNGSPEDCTVPADKLNIEDEYPQIFCREGTKYYKISPFIHMEEGAFPDIYVFNKIENKPTGETVFTQLFKSGKVRREVPDFKDISIINTYNRTSSNGTIINNFEPNYKKNQYIDVGILDKVYDLTVNNKSCVSVVLWGNGGVGKTACVQELCKRLSSENDLHFRYVVFVTAKDRRFNEATGKLEELSARYDNPSEKVVALNNICSFYDVIATIYSTIYEKPLACEKGSEEFNDVVKKILNPPEDKKVRHLLLIVDDFETFEDTEKKKITDFISSMDTGKHKVIITTRNKKLAEGKPVPASQLDKDQTVTFVEKMLLNSPDTDERIKNRFKDWISKPEADETLYCATGGVPVFILQWIYLFKQNLSENILSESLQSQDDAREFLSGRVYSALSEEAKILYSALPKVTSEQLTFFKERLQQVCEGYIKNPDTFGEAFEELCDMYLVEEYDDSSTVYRVYSETFLNDMRSKYNNSSESFRKSVSQRLKNSGENSNLSLFSALLKEAEDSRTGENRDNTIKKYKNVIALPNITKDQKRKAMTDLLRYFISQINDPEGALDTMYSYGDEFIRDPAVMYQFIYTLWGSGDKNCKKLAIEEIEKYFDANIPLCGENVKFFALASAYYTMHAKSQNISSIKSRAFDLGSSLYKFISTAKENETIVAVEAGKHDITVSLFHLLELIISMGKEHQSLGTEIGKYIISSSNNIQYINRVKSLLSTIDADADDSSHQNASKLPEGSVLFSPEYIKYNADGIPQYLNGNVDGTKGGIPWFDFKKFGPKELAMHGDTHTIMETLCNNKKDFPVMITSTTDKGSYSLYTLSAYNVNLSISELIGWGDDAASDNSQDSSEGALIEGVVSTVEDMYRLNNLTGQKDVQGKRGEILGDNHKSYRIGKAEMAKTPELAVGDRVSFTVKINTNPNARGNALCAYNIRKI